MVEQSALTAAIPDMFLVQLKHADKVNLRGNWTAPSHAAHRYKVSPFESVWNEFKVMKPFIFLLTCFRPKHSFYNNLER